MLQNECLIPAHILPLKTVTRPAPRQVRNQVMEQVVDLDKLLFQQANGPFMPVLKKLLSLHDLVFLLKELAARQEAHAAILRSLASRQDALFLLKKQALWNDVIDALVPAPPCHLARNCTARVHTPPPRAITPRPPTSNPKPNATPPPP